MGECSEGVAANGTSESNGLGTCEAHHVTSGPQEDCGVPAGAVGQGETAEEGGVAQSRDADNWSLMSSVLVSFGKISATAVRLHSRVVELVVSMSDGGYKGWG